MCLAPNSISRAPILALLIPLGLFNTFQSISLLPFLPLHPIIQSILNTTTSTQFLFSKTSHGSILYCLQDQVLAPQFEVFSQGHLWALDLEKAEEPKIKLPTSTGSSKKQENSRKTSTSASLTMPKPLTIWITKNWKILKEMGIPDHLTCLMKNLYAGQEATVRTRCATTDWFKIGEGVHGGCILSPWVFNFYAEYIMRNARLDESQDGIKTAGEISTTSDMQMTPH